eukprot:3595361-Rhodomonas_salina.3
MTAADASHYLPPVRRVSSKEIEPISPHPFRVSSHVSCRRSSTPNLYTPRVGSPMGALGKAVRWGSCKEVFCSSGNSPRQMVQEYVSQLPFSPADELMGRNRPDDAVTREEADAADELLPDPCHSTGCLNEQKPPKHPWSNRCSMSGVFGKSVDNLISLRQLARDFFTSADDLLVNMDRTPSLQKAYELQAQEEK